MLDLQRVVIRYIAGVAGELLFSPSVVDIEYPTRMCWSIDTLFTPLQCVFLCNVSCSEDWYVSTIYHALREIF